MSVSDGRSTRMGSPYTSRSPVDSPDRLIEAPVTKLSQFKKFEFSEQDDDSEESEWDIPSKSTDREIHSYFVQKYI